MRLFTLVVLATFDQLFGVKDKAAIVSLLSSPVWLLSAEGSEDSSHLQRCRAVPFAFF